MIILGVVLMLIGFIAKIPILWSVGIVIAVVGVVLMLLGMAGREIGGRRHYYQQLGAPLDDAVECGPQYGRRPC